MTTEKHETADFLVVGAGMAGASAGHALSRHGRVVVLEQEDMPGYHTTGRSAAFFAETYGNEAVRRLTSASKEFFLDPPEDFASAPLVRPRGALFIAREDQRARLAACLSAWRRDLPRVQGVGADAICKLVPGMRPDYAVSGVLDPECRDIDVHALHQGYLRGLRRRGGVLYTGARVAALSRQTGDWQVATADGRRFSAPIVINAAGAWADDIARMAGAAPVGLVPKRRTIVIFPAPRMLAHDGWPLVLDADDSFYFKPETGRILASPGDATPMAAQDVQPDLEDVALTIDRIEAATTFKVERVDARWAGLRTFAPDDTPVVGEDAACPGFFWFAGQGGFGIQTAPAMTLFLEGLVTTGAVGRPLAAHGVEAAAYAPGRMASGKRAAPGDDGVAVQCRA